MNWIPRHKSGLRLQTFQLPEIPLRHAPTVLVTAMDMGTKTAPFLATTITKATMATAMPVAIKTTTTAIAPAITIRLSQTISFKVRIISSAPHTRTQRLIRIVISSQLLANR